jgi:rhodanese-related sulfurtransferase
MKKTLAIIALALTATFGLAACAAPAPTITVAADTVVLDVRTPAEFAGGHLEGAVNIDIQSADFAEQISALPLDGDYVIYCASGNRSGVAIGQMEALGFTNLTDAKGVSAASSSTGLDVVTEP